MSPIVHAPALLAELRYRRWVAQCHLSAVQAFAHKARCLLAAGTTYRECRKLRVPNKRISVDLWRSVGVLKQAALLADEYDESLSEEDLESVVVFAVAEGILSIRQVNDGVDSDARLVRLLEPHVGFHEALATWRGRRRANCPPPIAFVEFILAPWFGKHIWTNNFEEFACHLAAWLPGHPLSVDQVVRIVSAHAGRTFRPAITRRIAISTIKQILRADASPIQQVAAGRRWALMREFFACDRFSHEQKLLSAIDWWGDMTRGHHFIR
jgi:hypothetical protein